MNLWANGSPELKATYLPKLASGQWVGTMCLTEPQAGTDLGLLRTRAEPQADGSYRLTGSKIFISGGEHDRLPDAPSGVKGISVFLVPKVVPSADDTLGRVMRQCLALCEEIRAGATAVTDRSTMLSTP